MSQPTTNVALRVVRAAGPVDPNYMQEVTLDPVTGGMNVAVAASAPSVLAPSTPYESTAFEASAVLKAAPGTFRTLYVDLNPSLAAPVGAQVYWILLMGGSATVPGDGNISANLLRAVPVQWVAGVPQPVTIDEGDAGIAFLVGCTVCLSLATLTTWATKALGTASCRFHGSVL